MMKIYLEWLFTAFVWIGFYEAVLPPVWDYIALIIATLYVVRTELFGLISTTRTTGADSPYHSHNWPIFGYLARIFSTLLFISLMALLMVFVFRIPSITNDVSELIAPALPEMLKGSSITQLILGCLIFTIGGFLFVVAWRCANFIIYYGAIHTQFSGDSMREMDPRRPILYLRSFDRDVPVSHSEIEWGQAFRKLGPFVAIARPGAKLPALGASRFRVQDGKWQDFVMELMKGSAL